MNQKFVKSQKLEKWLNWMDKIQADIAPLLLDVNVFWEVQDIIKQNPHIQKPSYFYHYLERSYVSHASAGVRRQIRHQQDSISFAGLLEDIAENANELSFSYYFSIRSSESDFQRFQQSGVPFSYREMIEKEFKKYADLNCEYVCPKMVKEDLKKLKEAAKPWMDFTDKRVAHLDKREPKSVPTFPELDNCLKLLDKTYVKYYLLFYAGSMETLEPTFQHDWKAIFQEPWTPKIPVGVSNNELF